MNDIMAEIKKDAILDVFIILTVIVSFLLGFAVGEYRTIVYQEPYIKDQNTICIKCPNGQIYDYIYETANTINDYKGDD